MPADYRIDVVKRRVFSSGTGHLSREDIEGHMNRLAKDPKFDPAFSQILDFRAVVTIGLDPSHIMEFAEIRIFSPDSKRAFVTPEPVKFGMARMYEAYRTLKGDKKIRVFINYDEAIEWLDLDDAHAPLAEAKCPITHKRSV
jgi:hypothetical protein